MRNFSFILLLLQIISIQQFSNAQAFDCEEELFSKKDKTTRLFGYVNALGEFRIPPVFLKAKPFIGKTAIVQQGKLFGIINCDGILVVPAEYDEIFSFFNGKGWVKKGGLFGLVSDQGRMLIQPVYEEVKEVNSFSGSVTWVKKGGLWGLLSRETGRLILPPRYDDVSVISDSAAIGRATASQDLVYTGDGRIIIQGMRSVSKVAPGIFVYESKDRLAGAFNSLAYTILRPEFESIRLNLNFLQTRKNGKSGLRSLRAQVILPEIFDTISPYIGGFASVRRGDSSRIVDTRGRWNLPPALYQHTSVLNAGFSVVVQNQQTAFWSPSEKKWISSFRPVRAETSAGGDWLRVSAPNRKWQLQEARDVPVSKTEWDSLNLSDPANAIRAGKDGKMYLISANTPFPERPFNDVIPLGSSFFACRVNGKSGVLGNMREQILPFEFDEIKKLVINSGTVFLVRKENREMLFSDKGKLVYQGDFSRMLPASAKLQISMFDEKWGIAKADGSWLVENKYDSVKVLFRMADECRFPLALYRKGKSILVDESGKEITESSSCFWYPAAEGKLFRREKEKYTLVDAKGKQVGDLEFEDFRLFSDGLAPVNVQGNWGFVNHSGRLAIPAKYTDVLPFVSGIAYARENGLWGVLKKNGTWLVKPSGVSVFIDQEGKRKLVLP